MLKSGEIAPQFSGEATSGKKIQLSDFIGKKVVIYFFPKAFTQGCTLETQQFRDAYPDLVKLGVEVIGISVDPIERQCAFAEQEQVSFPMIADENKEIAKKYDVLWPILGVAQRVTYLVDEQGKIEAVFRHELQVKKHIENIKEHLAKI